MRSKYVVSIHTLEIAVSVLQPLMGSVFPSLSTPSKYFLPMHLLIVTWFKKMLDPFHATGLFLYQRISDVFRGHGERAVASNCLNNDVYWLHICPSSTSFNFSAIEIHYTVHSTIHNQSTICPRWYISQKKFRYYKWQC